ncbi:MAG: hypothetical protein DVB28_002038 [Verrucomicrobia bacterium]|nr:MAG: hypothetical protein DVB28_002038 [Verrucomicrobiota bacterium]
MNLGGQAEAEFRVSAGQASGKVDSLAAPVTADLCTDCLNEAGAVHAWGVREGGESKIVTGADIPVHGVDSSGMDTDQDLVGCGFEVWQILEL